MEVEKRTGGIVLHFRQLIVLVATDAYEIHLLGRKLSPFLLAIIYP
jgi:hypothetical protein